MSPGNINKPAFQLARVEEGGELYQQTEIIMIGEGARPASAHMMSRRDFLGVTITAGTALAFLNGCGRDEALPAQTVIAKNENRIGTKARVLGAHKDRVYSIAISPDGNLLVSRSADNTVKLWNLHERVLITALQGYDNSVCISPGGKLPASGSADKTIRLWSFPDGEFISCLADLADNSDSNKGAVFSVTSKTGQNHHLHAALRRHDSRRGRVHMQLRARLHQAACAGEKHPAGFIIRRGKPPRRRLQLQSPLRLHGGALPEGVRLF